MKRIVYFFLLMITTISTVAQNDEKLVATQLVNKNATSIGISQENLDNSHG